MKKYIITCMLMTTSVLATAQFVPYDKNPHISILTVDHNSWMGNAFSVFELIALDPGVQVSGIFPNQTATMRGIDNSFIKKPPLYVLDGVVVDTHILNTLPIHWIEYIEIRKGNAGLLYGSQGRNGVIAIKTWDELSVAN